MPSRNVVKTYVENAYYHTYNRGIEQSDIFRDDEDYRVFLYLLTFYLSPISKGQQHPLAASHGFQPVRLRPFQSLHEEVKLLAYCLMPNHFHLLLWQATQDGITRLHRRVCTIYSMYFNRKYDRVGHLFQGTYKAASVATDDYLLHVSRYIHLNPKDLQGYQAAQFIQYPYSSYPYYLGKKHADWVHPELILDFFRPAERNSDHSDPIDSYRAFVENYLEDLTRKAQEPRQKNLWPLFLDSL